MLLYFLHIVEQVEALCSDIVIINDGEIKLEGDVGGLSINLKKSL